MDCSWWKIPNTFYPDAPIREVRPSWHLLDAKYVTVAIHPTKNQLRNFAVRLLPMLFISGSGSVTQHPSMVSMLLQSADTALGSSCNSFRVPRLMQYVSFTASDDAEYHVISEDDARRLCDVAWTYNKQGANRWPRFIVVVQNTVPPAYHWYLRP
jgi:hypothetical protein